MIENQLGSSQDDNSHDQLVPGEFPEQASDPPIAQSRSLPESEDEVEQQLLICLAKEGGVQFLDLLLAKAVSLTDLRSPDTKNIQELTYKDILRMPTEVHEEWKQMCCEELESLRRQCVYELVDLLKGRKVIKN